MFRNIFGSRSRPTRAEINDFMEHVRAGNLPEVQRLINYKNSFLKITDHDGIPPLIAAIDSFKYARDLNCARLLLERGVSLNAVEERTRNTALITASCEGHREPIELLLDHGANIDLPNKAGQSALIVACMYGRAEAVKCLISHGAAIELCTHSGHNALFISCWYDHVDVAKALVEVGANLNVKTKDGWTNLTYCCYYGRTAIAKVLIRAGADLLLPSLNGWSPLTHASYRWHRDIVVALLDKGVDIDKSAVDGGWSPLTYASYYGKTDIVALLLDKGADINYRSKFGRAPLLVACWEGRVDTARYLLRKGADFMLQDEVFPCVVAGCVVILVPPHFTPSGPATAGGIQRPPLRLPEEVQRHHRCPCASRCVRGE